MGLPNRSGGQWPSSYSNSRSPVEPLLELALLEPIQMLSRAQLKRRLVFEEAG
jgi:hypothetical protein